MILSFAIVCLALSYVLFTSQQYFSIVAMLIVFIIAIAAFAIFILAYMRSSSGALVLDVKNRQALSYFPLP